MVWKMFKVNDKKHQSGINDVVLVFLLLTLNKFPTFSSVVIVSKFSRNENEKRRSHVF